MQAGLSPSSGPHSIRKTAAQMASWADRGLAKRTFPQDAHKRVLRELCKSLTWDRGKELADHPRFTLAADVDATFAIHSHLGNADQMKIPTDFSGSICHAELVHLSIRKQQSVKAETSAVLQRRTTGTNARSSAPLITAANWSHSSTRAMRENDEFLLAATAQNIRKLAKIFPAP
jgi:hypothetical protein